MATSYPGALDSWDNPTATTPENAGGMEHHALHGNHNDAIEAIEGELGTDPAGSQATVKARLDVLTVGVPSPVGWWESGAWVINAASNDSSGTFTSGASIYYMPWWCPQSVTLDRIAVEVTAAIASANARLGIYTAASTGGPGSLLLDAGEIDCSTNAVKELTVSQALDGGTPYWLAILNETNSVGYKGVGTGSARTVGMVSGTTASIGRATAYVARTYTDGLPSSAGAWSTLSTATVTPPVFWLRRT